MTHSMFWHSLDAGVGVLLIAFTATWTVRAYLPLSIHGNLCPFMISKQEEHLLMSLFTKSFSLTLAFLCPVGDPSGWTPGGRHTGDHPRHEPWAGFLGHGGQCGGSRSEVHPCRGWLHHRWTVSHPNRTSTNIIILTIVISHKLVENCTQFNECRFLEILVLFEDLILPSS